MSIKMWNVFYMPILHCWILESLRQIFNPIPVIKKRKRITNTKRINQKKLDISIAFLLPKFTNIGVHQRKQEHIKCFFSIFYVCFFPFLFIYFLGQGSKEDKKNLRNYQNKKDTIHISRCFWKIQKSIMGFEWAL